MEPINPRHIQDLGLAEGQPAGRRRRIEHDDSTPLPYLHIGIITKILERLPVKSLLRFRSVCKSWRFLISSPKFVKTHMGLSAKNNEFHHLMLSADMPGDFEIKCCPLYSAPYADAIELHHLFGNLWPRATYSIVGSCNGLVCVTIDIDELYLWNPCTRECKKLPNLDVELVYILDYRYGLGYDDFSDDFKVVGVFTGFLDLVYKVWVYSVKAGSWRRIQDFPCALLEGNDGVYANGALHWAANRHRTPRERYPSHIISLDLRDETYREVALPTYGDGNFTFSVGALGGSLIVRCACGSRVDLWLMKEYSVAKSWTKMVSIPLFMSPMCSMPLCILKNGVILFKSEKHIVLYNSKDNTLKHCEIHYFRMNYRHLLVDTYVESLVSPKTDIELQVTLAAIEETEDLFCVVLTFCIQQHTSRDWLEPLLVF